MMRNWRVSLNKSEKSMKMKEKYVTFECCCWRKLSNDFYEGIDINKSIDDEN